MWFVYVIKSIGHPFIYVGHTNDLEKRVKEHNEGLTQSTRLYAPFELEAYVAVKTKEKVVELEKYSKEVRARQY